MKRYISWIMCMVMVFGMMLSANAALSDSKALSNAVEVVEQAGQVAEILPKIKSDEISGWGAQIGIMLKGFVESVGSGVKMTTEEICRVADTRVGKICTFVIVYKIIGKDLIETGRGLVRTICGVILLVLYISFVYKFYRAFFFPIPVLSKIDLESKTKIFEYKMSLAEKFDSETEYGVSWIVALFSIFIFFGVGALICTMI